MKSCGQRNDPSPFHPPHRDKRVCQPSTRKFANKCVPASAPYNKNPAVNRWSKLADIHLLPMTMRENVSEHYWAAEMTTEVWDNGEFVTGAYEDCPDQDLPYGNTYIPILYSIAFLIGFFGNIFVIVLMVRKQGARRLVDTFIINLAVADLVFVCTLPLWSATVASEQQWYFGDALCKISSFVIMVNRCSSILFLTGMSVDRYLAIVKLMDSRCVRTRKCVFTTCLTVWLISFLMGIPSLVFRKTWTEEDTNTSYCMEEMSPMVSGIKLTLLLFTFVLPMCTILFCYCSILFRLSTHIYPGKRTKNSLKIIFTIVGTFICCWLPFNLLSAIYLFSKMEWTNLTCSSATALKWSLSITACFAFMNSCVNPIIYIFLDRYFRYQVLRTTFTLLPRSLFNGRRPSLGSSCSLPSESFSIFSAKTKSTVI
ncbi:probable G-protein coupled receptor 25 [Ambystoma mexicanum]|uniref:probable G-protein coupled receptor 25 n=1 Tax=Ambystoma mexicanum TaxID=8296 RepID=UPI0037E712D9